MDARVNLLSLWAASFYKCLERFEALISVVLVNDSVTASTAGDASLVVLVSPARINVFANSYLPSIPVTHIAKVAARR